MSDTYITLIGSVGGNERDGFRTYWGWNGHQYATKPEAVSNGFTEAGSDDFQVGVVRHGKLAEVWWMDHQIDEEPAVLAEVAREVGL